MIAGNSTRDSTPPRLSAILKMLQARQNAPRLGQAVSDFEGHHAAEAIHLGGGNVVSGVVGETGIVDPPHTRLLV